MNLGINRLKKTAVGIVQSPLPKQPEAKHEVKYKSMSALHAGNTVDIIFKYILAGVDGKVKFGDKEINAGWRAFMKTFIPSTNQKVKEFVADMDDTAITGLLNEISVEMDGWKKELSQGKK